jgi:hypothetical protein
MSRVKECAPTPYSSVVFSLDSHLSPSRSWECINNEGELFDYIHVGTSIMAKVIFNLHHQNAKLLLCPYELCY